MYNGHIRSVILLFSSLCPVHAAAADVDLLAPPADAPIYRLSNLRTEQDPSGNRVISIDFTRTRKGTGSVVVKGKSAQGMLSIAAHVPALVDSGTMQLKSLFPDRGNRQLDIELFFAQPHTWGDGKTRHVMVSNPVRLGNPGPASKPRPWTPEEQAMRKEYQRIMTDDAAHKPRKSYSVSIEVPEDSLVVPQDAKLIPGTPLEACYSGKWNPLTTLSQNKDGTINVRWDDYGANYDCSMIREELIIKKAMLDKLRSNPSLSRISREEAEKSGLIAPRPKPRKSYAVSINVPSHSMLVPADVDLAPGTKLQACYAGKWNPITFLSANQDGTLNVRWDDYGESFDCSMVRNELIIRKTVLERMSSAADRRETGSTPPAAFRTWTDSTGQFKVNAKLLRKSNETVTLLTDGGREVTLPLRKLSATDRKYLESSSKR